MRFIDSIFAGHEPTLLVSLVRVTLILVVAFGLRLSTEQMAAIIGFSEVFFMLFNRSKVVSNSKIKDSMTEKQSDKVFSDINGDE